MQDEIAELRRQLEKERQAREEAEQRQKETERQVQPNTLLGLLDRCHNSLSQAIRVETDATLTTQGDATNPVNRLYPKRIVPWLDFSQLQESVWRKVDRTAAFTSRPLFPSDTQLDYVATTIKPIYSEASLRNFERDTVDNFVEMAINTLRNNDALGPEFGIQGRVAFYDRANPTETSLEDSLEQMTLQNALSRQQLANVGRGKNKGKGRGAAQSRKRIHTTRRRNRRADQFCVQLIANEQQKPVYAVEFKAPHKVTIPELVAGLHAMDLDRDVIDQEGDTFEFHATRLIAAVVTQIFSYMIDSGVQYGYICTGEAFVFLHIPEDPTVVKYFMCVPNQDVQADDEWRLHRTAIGQVLAFTLQALAAKAPSHEWHDAAHKTLSTWEVEYLDILRSIPETVRKDPPASNYRPSYWKPEPKIHNTRSRTRCRPGVSTPNHPSSEGSDSDAGSPSPSATAAGRTCLGRGKGNNNQPPTRHERIQAGRVSQNDKQTTRIFCTMACIRGIVSQESLDKRCPNLQLHMQHPYGQRHSMGPQEFTRRLHRQLMRSRHEGFEPLHVRGRTGYLVKATLLSHGYTVIIKATTIEKQHFLEAEVENYCHLKSLQGQQIPVCLGVFKPRVAYWYHGELMVQMMILSWSGTRLQHIVNDENSSFFNQERDKSLAVLRSHGAVHSDSEWRNMLWDDLNRRLVVVDLEDIRWLKRPRALVPTFGNMQRGYRLRVGEKARSYSPVQPLSTHDGPETRGWVLSLG